MKKKFRKFWHFKNFFLKKFWSGKKFLRNFTQMKKF